MFFLAERTASVEEGRRLAETMVASGQALGKFRKGIELQGGDARVVEDYKILPTAQSRIDVTSTASGFSCGDGLHGVWDCSGDAGRRARDKEDKIDHGVGLEFRKRIGDRVEKGEPLATIHYNSDAKLGEAKSRIAGAFVFSEKQPGKRNWFGDWLGSSAG